MSKTLLAVGSLQECGKLISAAISQRWSVLHTLLFEDIQAALARTKVDLILLSSCSSRQGWENAIRDAWSVCPETPVVAIGSDFIEDVIVSVLTGEPAPAQNLLRENGAERERAQTSSLDGVAASLKLLELSPTLMLLEPCKTVVSYGIEKALTYIEAHYAEPLSLSDVAASASYSRCHFSKIFKEQLGICFVSYLSHVRIRHAKELLARTNMSVTNISLEVGFNDLSHFERVFRAIQHQSPSTFRFRSKKMASGAKNPPSFFSQPVRSYGRLDLTSNSGLSSFGT
ncbi:MAG TPA: AraC family transcriptional regulator [Pyrinomonadaceae bacterium]|jgi:AraC-like DNA-binding protein|nr:AraC family transcriptional regulator [Pyrinomonadaceae bacterium]